MNLQTTISIFASGTSEGVEKSWDTRGRGRNVSAPSDKEKVREERLMESINKMYEAIDKGKDPDEETLLDAKMSAHLLLNDLVKENNGYFGDPGDRGKTARKRDVQYQILDQRLMSSNAGVADVDNAVNAMHIDYTGLYHWVAEAERKMDQSGVPEKEQQERVSRLERMASRFNERVGTVPK